MKNQIIKHMAKEVGSPTAALIFAEIMDQVYRGAKIVYNNWNVINFKPIKKKYSLSNPVLYKLLGILKDYEYIDKKVDKKKTKRLIIKIEVKKMNETIQEVKSTLFENSVANSIQEETGYGKEDE